jgi:hypothetical protein
MKSRIMRWAGYVARTREGRVVYKVLVGIPEEKRPLGKPRRRWEGNIKADLQEVMCGVWTGLSWFRVENWEHGNELSGSIKCGEFLD